MFGFDPAHTPQLELSIKGNYHKAIPSQRYINVPNAFAWVDTNGDGLGDSWTLVGGGTPSIVTGNGFAGRAQRVASGASVRGLRNNTILITKGTYYRLRFRWRAGINLQLRLGGTATFISLGANTGNAVFYDNILQASTSAYIQFQIPAGDYMEISEVELWELAPARILDEGRSRNIHGFLYSGKAFQFDGLSSYIDCGNAASIQVTKAFSICFWIKSATNGKVILSKDDAGSNRAFQIYKDSSGKINFITVSGASVSTLVETTASIDDETWHRVVCTYNGNTKSIYVDGSLRISTMLSGAINNAVINLFIGKLGNNSAFLSAAISDVQLWGNALNGADILFDLQYPEKPAWQRDGTSLVKTDLKGHWWLLENSGYYTFDYSGNSNYGSLYGLTPLVQQKDIPQPAFRAYSQKVLCAADTILRANDSTLLRSIWNNGGKLYTEVVPYSDGEGDLGTILNKGQWTLRCEGENSGRVKLRLLVVFSGTTGEWVTTNPEVALNVKSAIEVTYNSASTAHVPVIKVNGTVVSITTAVTPSGTYSADSGFLLYAGDTAASTASFDGIIDVVRLYNNNLLKGAWNNEGIYRWSDLSGNNNHLVSSSANKEIFLLEDESLPGKDILGLPLTNVVVRHGMNFDTKTYCECGFSPYIDMNAATENFSASLWVRFFRPFGGIGQILISMQTDATSGFAFYVDGNLRITATLNALSSLSITTIQDNTWHFLVCTVERANKMRMFLDGTEVTYSIQDNLAFEAMTGKPNLRLGTRSYGFGSVLKGQMAGVTLHRKILSAEEQKHLYAYGKEHYTS
jgi:hypothetical protein